MAKNKIDFDAVSKWAEINIDKFSRPAKYTKFNSLVSPTQPISLKPHKRNMFFVKNLKVNY